MAELRPWLEVAEPRRDIADGSFDESLFAADLGMVDRGRGPADYLDPVTFCEKTYLTESLLAFLRELIQRLSGDMAAAGVYRLQTEFGGGKTHTLLGAYHLFRDPARVADTAFVRKLTAKLDRASLPQAKVVVLEGGALSAGGPDPDIQDAQVHTLLGQLAYRFGGQAAFAEVAEQDSNLRGSSTTQITKLLEAHAPCLILLDELLQYLTKALAVRTRREPRRDHADLHQGAVHGRGHRLTHSNLNKVILERESAISDDRIESLLREAIGAVAPGSAELRVEPRVEASADLSDNQQLTLGILDFSLRVGAARHPGQPSPRRHQDRRAPAQRRQPRSDC